MYPFIFYKYLLYNKNIIILLVAKKLYLIRIPELNISKIGVSKNPFKRIKELQTGCPYKLEISKIFESKYTTKVEKTLHYRFAHLKIDEDIHNLGGEWFNLPIADVANFTGLCETVEKSFDMLKENNNPFI